MGAESKFAKSSEGLDNLSVGHAGLYHNSEGSFDTIEKVTEVLTTFSEILCDIPLGIKDGGKTLITCEKGIKAFVKDELAKKENHLPNSELGVWIHYLTEGIKKDFGRTWEDLPRSIAPKPTKTQKAAKGGKRIMSKAEKNELLNKMDMKYYQDSIASGEITLEDAFASIKEALVKKQELEDAGYVLSLNKTEGVKSFDWEKIVEESVGNANAAAIYKKYKYEIVVPDLMTNFYQSDKRIRHSICNDVMKSILFPTAFDKVYESGITKWGTTGPGGFEKIDINNIDDLMKYLSTQGLEKEVKEIQTSFKINGLHLIKLKKPGMMKDRWLCIDASNKKSGVRRLYMIDKTGFALAVAE